MGAACKDSLQCRTYSATLMVDVTMPAEMTTAIGSAQKNPSQL